MVAKATGARMFRYGGPLAETDGSLVCPARPYNAAIRAAENQRNQPIIVEGDMGTDQQARMRPAS